MTPAQTSPSNPAAQPQSPTLAENLLERMRYGDRQAAAEFMEQFGTVLRRRVRGKLGHAMRRLLDSQELLSTVRRRLDAAVHTGRFRAGSVEELWGYLFNTADHVVVDVARTLDRLQNAERDDGPIAQAIRDRLRAPRTSEPELELEHLFKSLPDPLDREILSHWLLGTPHVLTAELLGLEQATTRKRWSRIRDQLRTALESTPN